MNNDDVDNGSSTDPTQDQLYRIAEEVTLIAAAIPDQTTEVQKMGRTIARRIDAVGKALPDQTTELREIATQLKAVREVLTPASPTLDPDVITASELVASIAANTLPERPAAPLTANWDGTELTAISWTGETVDGRFARVVLESGEAATKKISGSKAKFSPVAKDQAVLRLELRDTESGAPIVAAGPIFIP